MSYSIFASFDKRLKYQNESELYISGTLKSKCHVYIITIAVLVVLLRLISSCSICTVMPHILAQSSCFLFFGKHFNFVHRRSVLWNIVTGMWHFAVEVPEHPLMVKAKKSLNKCNHTHIITLSPKYFVAHPAQPKVLSFMFL